MSFLLNFFDKYDRVARGYPALILTCPVVIASCYDDARTAVTLLYESRHYDCCSNRNFLCSYPHCPGRWLQDSANALGQLGWTSFNPNDAVERQHDVISVEGEGPCGCRRSPLDLAPFQEKGSHNLDDAKRLIADAFAQVKTDLDLEKPDGKHQVHNIENGFARNLLRATWPIGFSITITAAVWCGAFVFIEGNLWLPVVGVISSLISALLFGLARRFWLPNLVKISADRYAEKAWTTFIEIKGRVPGTDTGKRR